jgi:hypothetical protein
METCLQSRYLATAVVYSFNSPSLLSNESTCHNIIYMLFVFRLEVKQFLVYSICYGNEGTSSSVSDVDLYVIIRNFASLFLTFFRKSYADGKFKYTFMVKQPVRLKIL